VGAPGDEYQIIEGKEIKIGETDDKIWDAKVGLAV